MTLSWESEETLLLIILYFLGKIWGVSIIIVHYCMDVENFFIISDILTGLALLRM